MVPKMPPFVKEIEVRGAKYVVREPMNPEEHRDLMEVEKAIWGGECYAETVPYHVSIALQEIGGLVLGIYEKSTNKLIGVLVTFPAIIEGKLALYSHMHGYIEGYRGKGIGLEVKKIQRDYAKSLGVDLIVWTYDPLLAPNAWFNIVKLGAIFRRYSPNHYGRMNVFYNVGIETDRVWAEWYIDSERVTKRLSGWKPKSVEYFIKRGAKVVLEASPRTDGLLEPRKVDLGSRSPLVLMEIPNNFTDILSRDKELANKWRRESRRVFTHYLARGYVGFEVVKSNGRFYYVLWRNVLDKILDGEYP